MLSHLKFYSGDEFVWEVCAPLYGMAALVCTSKVRGEVTITACWVMTSSSLDRLDCCFILWCCCVDRKFSQRCLWEECGQEVRSVELVIRRLQHSHLSLASHPTFVTSAGVDIIWWSWMFDNFRCRTSLWTLSEAVQCKVVTEVWSHDIKHDLWHGLLCH